MDEYKVVKLVEWRPGVRIEGVEEVEAYPVNHGWVRSWRGIGGRLVYAGDLVMVLAPRGVIVAPRKLVREALEGCDGH